MASPEKSGTKPVETTKDVDDEPMEASSPMTGDPRNVDSPPPVPSESEDTTSSVRAGDSVHIEGATASTDSLQPQMDTAAAESVLDEIAESSASTQSDLKDPASLGADPSHPDSGGFDASSCPQSDQQEKNPPRTASVPSSSAERSESTQRPASLVGIGESVPTASLSCPQQPLHGPGSSPKQGKSATFANIGRKIFKKSPFKGSSSARKREDSSGDENVVSPKSKSKSRTPGRKIWDILSPSKSKTLSPEGGETSGSQGESPVVEGKPNWFQRMRRSGRDGKGDQTAPPGPSLHEDPEISEGAQLTDIPIEPTASKKGIFSKMGFLKKPKSETTKREEDTEQYLRAKSPKPSPEDESASTVTESLSPLSERQQSEFSVEFDTKFQIRPLDEDQNVSDAGLSLASPLEVAAASSGTPSGEASFSPPEMDIEEATESGPTSVSSASQPATGSGITSGETSASQPPIDIKETDSGLGSAGPSVAQPPMDTSESNELEVISEELRTTQPAMDTEASESEATSGESSVAHPTIDTKATELESTPEEVSEARAGMENVEADNSAPPDEMPQRRRDPGSIEEEALLSPAKRPKTEY